MHRSSQEGAAKILDWFRLQARDSLDIRWGCDLHPMPGLGGYQDYYTTCVPFIVSGVQSTAHKRRRQPHANRASAHQDQP